MRISVFGLGYVGTVTAACLAHRGHQVVGVDVLPQKVETLNAGTPPIIEPGLEALVRSACEEGRLKATTDCAAAVQETELFIICVGTPSDIAGALEVSCVRQVLKEIGAALRAQAGSGVIVLRSTMLPGCTRRLVAECLGDPGPDSPAVYYFPEFLREGSAVEDFERPSLAVVGSSEGSPPPQPLLEKLFGSAAAVVNWETAELLKYACNAFHATKITFANEIGRIARPLGIDARTIMEILCRDTTLNISPSYMKPGNPFGGSCLPKDVRALIQESRNRGVRVPLLENLLPSNQLHLQSLLSAIASAGKAEITLVGLAFKPHTDDIRESAMVAVAQVLLEQGYPLRLYDPQVNLSRLIGSNKRVLEMRLPGLDSLLCRDLAEAVGQQGTVVVAQRCVAMAELAQVVTPQHRIIDVNGWPELQSLPAKYEGFCW